MMELVEQGKGKKDPSLIKSYFDKIFFNYQQCDDPCKNFLLFCCYHNLSV